jgi:hypothetical protein
VFVVISEEQLLDVFAAYNLQIWPLQILAYLLGIAALFLSVRKTGIASRLIPAILAIFWLWVAFFFWLPGLLQGYKPAYVFTAVFLIQGFLFLTFTIKPTLRFGLQKDIYSLAGIFFLLYALVGYPVVGILAGHIYPRLPSFGMTPCPLVTFTFGMLLLAKRKVAKTLLIIPFFYALSSLLWVSIGIFEDVGMIASGLLGAGMIWRRDSKTQSSELPVSCPPLSAGWSLDLPEEN